MNKQTRQFATIITGQNTSDGAEVKLKRIINPQQNNFDPLSYFEILPFFPGKD